MPNLDGTWTEQRTVQLLLRYELRRRGNSALASLILDQSGSLYGTTSEGGAGQYGVGGTVFKLAPNSNGTWTESTLYQLLLPHELQRRGESPFRL